MEVQETIDNIATDVAKIGVRLLDDAVLAWFRAESECEATLQAWFQRTHAERRGAYFRLPHRT